MPYHVSKSRFNELVEQAIESLPPRFARYLEEVAVEVRDRPTDRQGHAAGLGEGRLLLGLYQGRPLTQRSVEESGVLPDVIFVFQENIEQVCASEAALVEQVRITVLHEIGHHFGLSEADLDELGYG